MNRSFYKTLAFAFLITLNTMASYAGVLPRPDVVPGGIAIFDLGKADQEKPVVRFGRNQVMIVEDNKHWKAVIGLPLDVIPGRYFFTVKKLGEDKPQQFKFSVLPRQYSTQRLNITNKNQVEPNRQDLKRIKKERAAMDAVYNHWSDVEPVSIPLTQPVSGRLSSSFGLRRIFNDKPRNPHSGLDIAAPRGQLVVAPASGVIGETGRFFFNGNTVMIDHGQGMVSMMCHLSWINVKKGDKVNRGDTIGRVGSTGRATGPHLHWSLSLNNARVNPKLFLAAEEDKKPEDKKPEDKKPVNKKPEQTKKKPVKKK